MNANHVLFWEVFLSICSVCLTIALGTHFWFLRKKHRARKAVEKDRRGAKLKKVSKTRKRQRRK